MIRTIEFVDCSVKGFLVEAVDEGVASLQDDRIRCDVLFVQQMTDHLFRGAVVDVADIESKHFLLSDDGHMTSAKYKHRTALRSSYDSWGGLEDGREVRRQGGSLTERD